MMGRLCHVFLTRAARRWPTDLRDEMLTEWRAELHAMPGTSRRLRYAASLATSRPHREPAVVVSPGRIRSHAILALLFVAGLPMVYLPLALNWTAYHTPYTIAWQTWVAGGSVVGAVALGLVCARMTTGVMQKIRPALVPLWTIGVGYAAVLTSIMIRKILPDGAEFIDLTCWALSAAALCMLAARVARAGHIVLSWGVVLVAGAVTFWFANMHNALSDFSALGMEYFFDGRFLPAFVFVVAKQEFLHVSIFLLVYAHQLVRRHRAVRAHVAVPPVPA
ncbi:hypothetical protein AB0B31_05945 [Catellatospora citrea]|uniref:hypothetical protein n=1 Tax=Catellatospora citrea TaxID=53366 RepID=UPI0033E576D3